MKFFELKCKRWLLVIGEVNFLIVNLNRDRFKRSRCTVTVRDRDRFYAHILFVSSSKII
jgi:hypothetical protein